MCARLKQILALCALLALLVLPSTQALAQSDGFVCRNSSSNKLDCDQIERAAQPLIARGAQVAVYLTDRGDESGQDFLQKLAADELGFADQNRVQPELIGIYVSMQPRYAELRVGDSWTAALDPGDSLTRIRTEQLTPALRSAEYTRGYVDSLQAIEATLSGKTSGFPAGNLALGALAVTGLAGGGYAARRWQKKRSELNEQRWHVDNAHKQSNCTLIEVSEALQKEHALAEYDAVSYSASNAKSLAEQRQTVAKSFAALQERFDSHVQQLERSQPSLGIYADMTKSFGAIQSDASQLLPRLKANTELRQKLDQQQQRIGAELERVRGSIDQTLNLLPPGLSEAQHAMVRERQQRSLAQVDSALELRDTEQALSVIQQTAAELEQTRTFSQHFQEFGQQIEQANSEIETLADQGYRIEASRGQLSQAQEALPKALELLVDTGVSSATQQLALVENSLAQAATNGRGLLAQRASNEQRLLELGVRARQINTQVEHAHQAFDLVDEFAETCWSDIRGNGSSAEVALTRAGKSWQQALASNSLEQQNFQDATQALQSVDEELQRAQQLTEAIVQRLKDLKHARAIAQEELGAAHTDLEAARAYIQEHNADISPAPEAELERASTILQSAQSEAVLEKPDWLKLVRSAQEANQLAYTVLVSSRSEAEAIERLRQQIKNTHVLAAKALDRIRRYYELNRSDLSFSSTTELKDIENALAIVSAAGVQAENLQDFQRLEALRNVYQRMTALEQRTDQFYSKLHREVQRIASQRAAEAQSSSSHNTDSSDWGWLFSSSSSSRSSHSSSSSSSHRSSGGSSGGSSWGGGGSSGGSSWGGGSKSGGGW